MLPGNNDPNIKFGPLSLWIAGPTTAEDWLDVVAVCSAPSATISTSGQILEISDLRSWLAQLEKMNRTLSGVGALVSAEPNLRLEFAIDKLGNIAATLDITPDVETQVHQIKFLIDQSYLPAVIDQLMIVIEKVCAFG
jgi:hypothetical protein